ncbi:hypothetical protein C4579_00210 [Candidatus Microgenomates bacterium]|nr:MAG: hypothetical protein C4579_00210 [Candidatus Microgenomates bacterium]
MSRLVLIDGNAILHRAFHALPHMNNSKGQPTQAVYGFISMLLTVINQLKPSHLIVTFDRPKPTFRNKLYKDYQAQRPKMDEDLVNQIELVHQVVAAMQIPIFEVDGYEADDVLGSIAKQVQSSKLKVNNGDEKIDETVIVTGDRDLLQLVTDRVKLFMPIKGLSEAKLYGEQEAKERMGVPPNQVVELKGLMGDPSDNYPGVAGIGPKTAANLLKEFGTVENIYKNLDKIKNASVAEKLKAGRENAFLSHKLATVLTDAPVTLDIDNARLHSLVNQQVLDLFGELEFKGILKRLLKTQGEGAIAKDESKQKKGTSKSSKDQLGLF